MAPESSEQQQLQDALGTAYVLKREIGRGGMARVYVAEDTKHGRLVALKVLHPGLTMSLGAERFRREIAVAASLHHPHVLTVLDSGATSDGQLWFTMPYVDGENLRTRLSRDGALPIADALRVALQAADALEYAHDRGIVHRDIKPENILLSGSHALVADFGIARLLAHDDDATGDALTTAGMVIGTPGYMSPEQASGAPLDARTDVYSLGVVLYEMLAGESPFHGVGANALFAAMIAMESPSVRRARPEVPEHVDVALRKALAPAPSDRWSSVGEFAEAVQATAGAVVAPLRTSVRARRALAVTLALGLGLTIGAGVLHAWKDTRVAPSTLRLAVLPFENVGDSGDAYFADGVTDAVRGKLAGLPGLEVTGSTSSARYRHSAKTPREIGEELGVPYLLEGKVRWAKAPDGTSRVRVTPELVDVGTATDKWEQPFDAPLTDVFQVQTDIAGEVAQELEIALTPAMEQTLARQPTTDMTAYDAYLRGEALSNVGGGPNAVLRRIAFLQDAVNRDSTFALAWAALARAQTGEYSDVIPRPAVADSADRNSARALALAPDLSASHTARGNYYLYVLKDARRALHEDSTALALAPRDANTLRRLGNVEATLGRWDAAAAHHAEAMRLDPQSPIAANDFGHLALLRGDYVGAQAALDHATMLAPTNITLIENHLLLKLVRGDLAGGRAVLRSVPPSVDRNSLVVYLASYGDLGWALDSSDATRLVALGPDAFGNDRSGWGIVLAQQYAFQGDLRRTRAYADSARVALERQLQAAPDDAQRHVILGLALAYLGRRDDAIREGKRGVALLPITRDALLGPYVQHQLVRIYMVLGEQERALDALEPARRVPYILTPAWLRIDPNFAPLRGNPRFERLRAVDTHS